MVLRNFFYIIHIVKHIGLRMMKLRRKKSKSMRCELKSHGKPALGQRIKVDMTSIWRGERGKGETDPRKKKSK